MHTGFSPSHAPQMLWYVDAITSQSDVRVAHIVSLPACISMPMPHFTHEIQERFHECGIIIIIIEYLTHCLTMCCGCLLYVRPIIVDDHELQGLYTTSENVLASIDNMLTTCGTFKAMCQTCQTWPSAVIHGWSVIGQFLYVFLGSSYIGSGTVQCVYKGPIRMSCAAERIAPHKHST